MLPSMILHLGSARRCWHHLLSALPQTIPNVPAHKEGVNPATWMLEISTPGQEKRIGVDFSEHYDNSEQFRCGPALHLPSCSRL